MSSSIKIYTKGGDKGTSQLWNGERRRKDDIVFQTMGAMDELCSIIGLVHAQLLTTSTTTTVSNSQDDNTKQREMVQEQLLEIMSRLFDMESFIAAPEKKKKETDKDNSNETTTQKETTTSKYTVHVLELEEWIDDMTAILPKLKSFILPTGSLAASQLHVARTTCRRAETHLVSLLSINNAGSNENNQADDDDDEATQIVDLDPNATAILQYMNRLSDYLFTAARFVNIVLDNHAEIIYRKPHAGTTQRMRIVRQPPTQKQQD